MALVTETTRSANGKGSLNRPPQRLGAAVASVLKRRRQVPWVVAGVLLVVGCGLAFGVASLRLSKGEQVLAVSKAVQAGQPIEAGDLQAVTLTPAPGLIPVAALAESAEVGKPAAVALMPGTLLTPADVGVPPAGTGDDDVVALALGAGAYPPALGAGDTVEVVPVPNASSAAAPNEGPASPLRAVVVAIDASPSGTNVDAVVSLAVPPAEAPSVAALAAAGRAALVELPAARRAEGPDMAVAAFGSVRSCRGDHDRRQPGHAVAGRPGAFARRSRPGRRDDRRRRRLGRPARPGEPGRRRPARGRSRARHRALPAAGRRHARPVRPAGPGTGALGAGHGLGPLGAPR